MTLILQTGDLFSTKSKAIGHGCNVQGAMGAGIAVQFRNRFPEMYEDYKLLCEEKRLLPGMTFPWVNPNGYVVYNIASQDMPGANARMEWLRSGVQLAIVDAKARGIDMIALPMIGAGIGGLNPNDVAQELFDLAAEEHFIIELWRLP